jgi:hypothetical protein
MGFTHWIFVQLPDLTFRYVGEGRFVNFQLGKAILPEVQPGEVRVVEVMLDLEEDLDPWLIHIECRRFPVLTSGYRDHASIEWERSLARAVVGHPMTTEDGSPEHLWAKRQTDQTFRWTPTDEEARAIADTVSRKATRPGLGGRPLRLVVPVAEPGRRSRKAKPKPGK